MSILELHRLHKNGIYLYTDLSILIKNIIGRHFGGDYLKWMDYLNDLNDEIMVTRYFVSRNCVLRE